MRRLRALGYLLFPSMYLMTPISKVTLTSTTNHSFGPSLPLSGDQCSHLNMPQVEVARRPREAGGAQPSYRTASCGGRL
ncbi:hypothetical protein EDB86DRAFT_2880557 [Lactarius hatsudake]|nr:hypothetical protein EDB86DRAFT_2880557 [Lactarius hatsudake]